MPRGRKRKHDPRIPAHIDQAALPAGIYWDPSGQGRWYLREARPDGGHRTRTVAGATARLSDLHAIAEARMGGPIRGTVAYVLEQFHAHREFRQLAASTRTHYAAYAAAINSHPTRQGPLGDQRVDRLTPVFFRTLVDRIADGRPATKPGEKAIPPYPSKANHWLRYLRRAFGFGIEHGLCTDNPCRGVKCVPEVRAHRMPSLATFRAVQAYARACSLCKPRERGALPPYLWAAMELAYQPRLRGIEVITLTDANDTTDGLLTNRRKGSADNIVRKGTQLQEAIDSLKVYRQGIWDRRKRPTPMRPEDRFLFVGEDGDPLSKHGFDTAFGRMMRNAVRDGVITAKQRFGMHSLKHRGVTDTPGTRAQKKDASGHKSDAMLDVYNHALARVEPSNDTE